ncbi:MAG: flagellar FlbD family protein [bacterium]|nr:flagellar FlbD family protein [bacterium]
MIALHRLKGEEFLLNHRLIETIERSPDTLITLTNERKYLVREKPEEVLELIRVYEQKILVYSPDSGTITEEERGE